MSSKLDKMVAIKKEQSRKVTTEVKLLIDMFYKTDVPIKKSEIMKHLKVLGLLWIRIPKFPHISKKCRRNRKIRNQMVLIKPIMKLLCI